MKNKAVGKPQGGLDTPCQQKKKIVRVSNKLSVKRLFEQVLPAPSRNALGHTKDVWLCPEIRQRNKATAILKHIITGCVSLITTTKLEITLF